MVRAGLLSDDQLAAVQVRSAERKLSFVEALLELGVVDEDSVVSFLHSKLMIPRVGASVLDTVDKGALLRIPSELAQKHAVLPISADETGNLTVAMVDPTDMRAVDAISAHTGAYLVRAVAPLRIIRAAIARHYNIPLVEPPTKPAATPAPAATFTAAPAASAPSASPVPPVAVPSTPRTVQPTTIVPGSMMAPPMAPPVVAPSVPSVPSVSVPGAPVVAPSVAPPGSSPISAPPVQPPIAGPRPPSSTAPVAPPVAAPRLTSAPPNASAPPIAAPPIAAPPIAAPSAATPPIAAAPPIAATPTRPPSTTASAAPPVAASAPPAAAATPAPVRAPSGPSPAATIKPSAVIRPTAVIQPSAVYQPTVVQPTAVVMPGPRPAVVLPASAQHSAPFGASPTQPLHPAFTPISTQPPTDVATVHAQAAQQAAQQAQAAQQLGDDFQPGGTATFEPAPSRRSIEPRPVNDDDETPPNSGDTLISGSRADVVDIPLDDLEDQRGSVPTRTTPPEDPDERVPTSTWTPPQFGISNEVIPLSPEAFHRLLPRFSAVRTRDEVTDLLLDFLAEGFSRVIMFTHIKGEIRGRDARGEDLMVDAVRQIRIPATGPSLFSNVIERRQPYFGPMRTDTAIDAAFYSALGGVDGVVLCLPVVLRDKVPLLVFASGSHNPVDPRSLQELTTEVSAALERLIVIEKARQK